MKAEDQGVHCLENPDMEQLTAALQHLTLTPVVFGIVPHPYQGITTSEAAHCMPNLQKMLHAFARAQEPRHCYTTVELHREDAPHHQSVGSCPAGGRIYRSERHMHSGRKGADQQWTIHYYTHQLAMQGPLNAKVQRALENKAFLELRCRNTMKETPFPALRKETLRT